MSPPRCLPLCHFGDRLFFTAFSHPVPQQHNLNAQQSEVRKNPPLRTRGGTAPASPEDEDALYYYFTIDDSLIYLSFFEDWGPLNISMVYKACILIHELLEDEELKLYRLVLYSSEDPKRKANAALIMALYVMIVQRKAPWEAFHPIADLEFMPFRDAGRGRGDFNLSIQDCLWGIWKALQHKLLDMNTFSVEEYEYYEKVENGDWNWLTPGFIAFASPVDPAWTRRKATETGVVSSATGSSGNAVALQRRLPGPFLNCLEYFEQKNVKLVVRLNNQLYDKHTFVERGIDHFDLFFEDGTNPTDEIVRQFIDISDPILASGGVVAVHCKAGLGRTGTLIGAYLIWKFGFTASEAIAFMRIVRPGSVVGPQQQYMYMKQLEWTKWAAADEIRKSQEATAAATTATAIVAPATPPAEADEEFESMPVDLAHPVSPLKVTLTVSNPPPPPVTPNKAVSVGTARADAISPPGQPRKTPRTVSKKRPAISDDEALATDEESDDEISALPMISPLKVMKPKPASAGSSSNGVGPMRKAASEQRPTRLTRSTAKGRPGFAPSSPTKSSAQPPAKTARLANGSRSRTTTTTTAATSHAPRPPTATSVRRPRPPPSPTPSRLPTLVTGKRPLGTSNANAAVAELPMTRRRAVMAAKEPDSWMKDNASAVVVPGSKKGRPLLRNVRRRRSSFSSVDVVV